MKEIFARVYFILSTILVIILGCFLHLAVGLIEHLCIWFKEFITDGTWKLVYHAIRISLRPTKKLIKDSDTWKDILKAPIDLYFK